MIIALGPIGDGSCAGADSSYGMKTHGSIVTNIAFWFTMLSPLIGLIIAFMGASFFSQSSF